MPFVKFDMPFWMKWVCIWKVILLLTRFFHKNVLMSLDKEILLFFLDPFLVRRLLFVIIFVIGTFLGRRSLGKPLSHEIFGLFLGLAEFFDRFGINVDFKRQTFTFVFDIANVSWYWVPRDLNKKKKLLSCIIFLTVWEITKIQLSYWALL